MEIKYSLLFVTLLCFAPIYAQIVFEPGYIIKDNGERIECLIKNEDWRFSPESFVFRETETAPERKGTLLDIQSFGIGDYVRYERHTVDIDRSSSDNLKTISSEKGPAFEEETLFLRLMLDGEIRLLIYEDNALNRFFYQIEEETPQQLIYKKYLTNENVIRTNNTYRQQMRNLFKDCPSIPESDLDRANYFGKTIVKLFSRYSECKGSEIVNYAERNKKPFIFHITPRVGGSLNNNTSVEFMASILPQRNTDFSSKLIPRLSLEVEFLLPFNRNKWSILVEPTYRSYSDRQQLQVETVEIDLNTFDIPIGLRHYFFLGSNSKVFLNFAGLISIPINSEIRITRDFGTIRTFDIASNGNFALGAGYKFKDKLSVELRGQLLEGYATKAPRIITGHKVYSLIFGYSIF
jgi:hypothetical protein